MHIPVQELVQPAIHQSLKNVSMPSWLEEVMEGHLLDTLQQTNMAIENCHRNSGLAHSRKCWAFSQLCNSLPDLACVALRWWSTATPQSSSLDWDFHGFPWIFPGISHHKPSIFWLFWLPPWIGNQQLQPSAPRLEPLLRGWDLPKVSLWFPKNLGGFDPQITGVVTVEAFDLNYLGIFKSRHITSKWSGKRIWDDLSYFQRSSNILMVHHHSQPSRSTFFGQTLIF